MHESTHKDEGTSARGRGGSSDARVLNLQTRKGVGELTGESGSQRGGQQGGGQMRGRRHIIEGGFRWERGV